MELLSLRRPLVFEYFRNSSAARFHNFVRREPLAAATLPSGGWRELLRAFKIGPKPLAVRCSEAVQSGFGVGFTPMVPSPSLLGRGWCRLL